MTHVINGFQILDCNYVDCLLSINYHLSLSQVFEFQMTKAHGIFLLLWLNYWHVLVQWGHVQIPEPSGEATSSRAHYQLAMPGLFSVMKYIWHEDPPLADEKNTLSLRSHKNLSRCAFLCMNTPSRWPLSTERISMALLPQPIICPVPM